jgi:heme-degrading monooxygenase HmoA
MGHQSTQTEAHIRADADVVTLINVFAVEPADQARLVELWQTATDDVMRRRPGFISASIHRSLDGTKVINYAQWQSREAFTAMFQDPEASEHLRRLAEVGTPNPMLCEVVSVHLPADDGGDRATASASPAPSSGNDPQPPRLVLKLDASHA